jgi:hypothetical protein
MNATSQFSLSPGCTSQRAVASFLAAMGRAAARSFPAWRDVLKSGLDECALDYDTRRAVYDIHPLDDLYFAAVVGQEAARIRGLFTPAETKELLAAIGEHVDAAVQRSDRIVSDLVFTIISRVDPASPQQEMAHDQVMAILLTYLGVASASPTRRLMNDLLFRHHLGAPLALDIPCWWPAFHSRFTLLSSPETASSAETIAPLPPPPPAIPHRSGRRRSMAQRII